MRSTVTAVLLLCCLLGAAHAGRAHSHAHSGLRVGHHAAHHHALQSEAKAAHSLESTELDAAFVEASAGADSKLQANFQPYGHNRDHDDFWKDHDARVNKMKADHDARWDAAQNNHATAQGGAEVVLVGVFFVAFIAAIITCACMCSTTRNMHRIMRKMPTVTAGQLAMYDGQTVKLVGRVAHNGQLLASPFSGKACVMYEVSVRERRVTRRQKPGGREGEMEDHVEHVTIAAEENSVEFLVTESVNGTTAACWVPGNGVSNVGGGYSSSACRLTMHARQDTWMKSGTFNNATPNCEAFLRRHGQSSTGFLWLNRDLSYSEGSVECGEIVGVCGIVKQIAGPHGPVFTLAAINAELIDSSQWSCFERNALRSLNGTILLTDDADIIGRDSVNMVQSQPWVPQNTAIPAPPAPQAGVQVNVQVNAPYYAPHQVAPPSFQITVNVNTNQAPVGYQPPTPTPYAPTPAPYAPTPAPYVPALAPAYAPPIAEPIKPAYAPPQQNPFNQNAANPYAQQQQNSANPYAPPQQAQNPYNQNAANPYAAGDANANGANPYAQQQQPPNPYAQPQQEAPNPYAQQQQAANPFVNPNAYQKFN